MIFNAEVLFGNYRIHAHSTSLDKAVELVKRGVDFHARQNKLDLSNWSADLIESDEYELEKCYRDYEVIISGYEADEIKALTRRLDDLWEGACNHPCDRANCRAADQDELTRFVVSVRRVFRLDRSVSLSFSSITTIDSLAHELYLQGVRA